MRRQHVVVGGDDADVHGTAGADLRLVLARRGEAVGKIAAAHARAVDAAVALRLDQIEIAPPCRPRSLDDAGGDGFDGGVEIHAMLQWISIGCSASASTRPIG